MNKISRKQALKKCRGLLLRAEKERRKSQVKLRPPKYDEVYYKGLEWLNSL